MFYKIIIFFLLFHNCYAEKAFDFTLKDINGKKHSLKDYKGKVVFLDFWASWCAPCRYSIPKMDAFYNKWKDKKVIFVGINLDSKIKDAINFAKKVKISYPTLLAYNSDVAQHYKVRAIPTIVVIDPKGSIIKRFVGYFDGIENEWEKIISSVLK